MWFEHNEELVAVRHAFYKACEELGIGSEDDDKERREQLEQVFLTIFNFGERDICQFRLLKRGPDVGETHDGAQAQAVNLV